ncbi:hypothetical protein BpHYR1_045462 [Brachionus plicatilis]|uniref:Uncharacterized protein n=1 Tax=Brachionus plicatilis TaxID=10195 RepID=A0A3M7T4B8_BRAPC|nr:hypothetical protein BpHYR1_045462 [Brachionus plicatilis]
MFLIFFIGPPTKIKYKNIDKEYKNFDDNIKKFYEQEKESIELLQSLKNKKKELLDYSSENLYNLTVHEFFKRQNDNIIRKKT